MKDFRLRNDTDLYFQADIKDKLIQLMKGHKVLFVYGGGSVKTNGCRDDILSAASVSGCVLYEYSGCTREYQSVLEGIAKVKDTGADLIIAAGGAGVMDAAKLIAFGAEHEEDLREYIFEGKNPYHLDKIPLVLIPTYPSSGSEYGLGAVCTDGNTTGTAYGIAADTALLCPRYSLSLNSEMTAYSVLVTFVQLSAAVIGDHNPMSFDAGVTYMKNVLQAGETLKKDPDNLDARGMILIGASLSTSSRLGLGKEDNYAYDIYELEDIPERYFNSPYRKSLTSIFPSFLECIGHHHEADVQQYIHSVFGFKDDLHTSCMKIRQLFESYGIDMYFHEPIDNEKFSSLSLDTELSKEEIYSIITSITKEG